MTAVMEDEVIADLADQGEESSSSLIAGCRNLLRAVTKVGSVREYHYQELILIQYY